MKCLYVYNPKSGKGKAEKKKKEIVEKLSSFFDELEVVKTNFSGHAKELASSACGKYDYLVVAGGDGTLNEVVNGVAEKEGRPILGYIPLGTVNDFAHSVGIPRNINKAVHTICNGKPLSHEIFKAGDHYGIYVCAMGIATDTSYATKQLAKKTLGKFAYFCYAFKRIFRYKPIPMTIQFDGGKIEDRFALLLTVNSRYVASFKINRNFAFNDGYVDIMLVQERKKYVRLRSLITIARVFMLGIGNRLPKNAIRLHLKEFTLSAPDSAVLNLDGEGLGSGKFNFTVIKDGVQIIVPK